MRASRSRPDFASLNFDEPGAAQLTRALLAHGIAVEAGLATPAAARALSASGLGGDCLRVLLEPQESDPAAALCTVTEIESVLAGARLETPRLLHGTGATAWPLLAAAHRRHYDARIGLEDTLTLPDGRLARDNAELVAVAVASLPATDPRRLHR